MLKNLERALLESWTRVKWRILPQINYVNSRDFANLCHGKFAPKHRGSFERDILEFDSTVRGVLRLDGFRNFPR